MSKVIKTRNPVQCHTHHQKMLGRFGSIESIVSNYTHLIDGKNIKRGKRPSELTTQKIDENTKKMKQTNQPDIEQESNSP
jgi:hypothetical protein